MEAIDECPAAAGGSVSQQLFPIDKLRYFSQEKVSQFYGSKRGLFRVNAMKMNDVWIQYQGTILSVFLRVQSIF